jgi:hypothetical protein
MTDTAKEKFDKAKLIDANSADSERLKFIYSWEIRKDPEAIDAAETAWRRTTIQPYIKGFRMILDAALEDQWFGNTVRAQDDYLMLGQIGRLGQHDAAPFLSELMGGELELWKVIETVKAIKTPKPRQSKPDLKQRLCELVQELEHDANNGAEMIVKATKRAIADKLREILDAPRA